MRFFISAGEPSGDLHAANLVASIKKLRPDASFVGFGGEHSRAAGVTLIYPLVELAVMWLLRVLWNLPTFFRLADEAERIFRDEKPDAVILIDYPGFHWALAKRAKRHGVPVIYYVPPQIWAWAGWRVKKVQKWVDLVLCSLPFEPDWQAPTAELRPQAAAQTDEDDLMPYDLLDAVERAAIRDKRSPLEILNLMRVQFPQHGVPQLLVWIERFFVLWCRNQWKRERYAPSFHLDDENLDPKTWCRFPILSGGFERELAEMKEAASTLA